MPTANEWTSIEKHACPIQGWASKRELCALFDSAKACTEGAIVEIGSWKGRSTTALGLGSRAGKNTTVYAIDPHTGSPDHLQKRKVTALWTFDEFKENMRKTNLEKIVEPILDTSVHQALSWGKSIELLFLDANYHDFQAGYDDFITWSAFVRDGGTIAMHNPYPSLRAILREGAPFHGWPGPRKVLRKLVYGKRGWSDLRIVDSTVFMRKNARSTFLDLAKGGMVQLKGAGIVLMHKLYQITTALPIPLKKFVKRFLFFRREN